jgi:hypothetical protein
MYCVYCIDRVYRTVYSPVSFSVPNGSFPLRNKPPDTTSDVGAFVLYGKHPPATTIDEPVCHSRGTQMTTLIRDGVDGAHVECATCTRTTTVEDRQ